MNLFRRKSPAKRKGGAGGKNVPPLRRLARRAFLGAVLAVLLLSSLGDWYVHHPPAWLREREKALPTFVTAPLRAFGDRAGLVTDALGWTGHDAVYDFDEAAPEGRVFFAGAPVRASSRAPADVEALDRGAFVVGYSPSRRRPVWVAYHVPREARFDADKRPNFRKDSAVPNCPRADALARSGYDRGHMAPNYAIVTRFGPDAQNKTFLMSNIVPQRPGLNRGPWRELEHWIADLWTRAYGEIWVIAGAIDAPGTPLDVRGVNVPAAFYMLVAAQTPDGVRALAVVQDQNARAGDFPVHGIVTVDELEEMTGWDFFAELPGFIQTPLEADRPTRLWPIRPIDLFRLLPLRLGP